MKQTVFLFAALICQSAFLGLSDDEAYYWSLSLSPDWGYAWHPGGVSWIQQPFRILGRTPWAVRLPAILLTCFAFFFLQKTLRLALMEAGVKSLDAALKRASFALLSFVGLFGAAWMITPDIVLFAAMAPLLYIMYGVFLDRRPLRKKELVAVFFLVAISFFGKLTAIFFMFSMVIVAVFCPISVPKKFQLVSAMVLGSVLGLLPHIVWNANHDWYALRYHLSERHGGASWNGLRYLRFWLVQAILAGPVLIYFALKSVVSVPTKFLKRGEFRTPAFFWIIAIPPLLVFGIQPAFSDFKIHWALMAWLPFAMSYAVRVGQAGWTLASKIQARYAAVLFGMSFLYFHFPIQSLVAKTWLKKEMELTSDISNDFYGWATLPQWLRSQPEGGRLVNLPVLGSRYQIASQARFVFPDPHKVSLVPLAKQFKDEWPILSALDQSQEGWPKLGGEVLFVADNRYSQGPEFPDSNCELVGEHRANRMGYLAKVIKVWRCRPQRQTNF